MGSADRRNSSDSRRSFLALGAGPGPEPKESYMAPNPLLYMAAPQPSPAAFADPQGQTLLPLVLVGRLSTFVCCLFAAL